MQKEIELRILSLILKYSKLHEAVKLGLDSDCFVIYNDQFSFVGDYIGKYKSYPSEAILKANYHEFDLDKDVPEDELSYLVNELVKGKAYRQAAKVINKYVEVIDKDPYGAIDAIVGGLSKIKKVGNFTISHTDKNIAERMKAIKERKQALTLGQTVGIRTGISVLDRKLLGWQPGNLVIIVGRPKIGKSWLGLYLACSAYAGGKRVLYLSPEMSVFEVELRWDTLMGKMNGFTFLNDKLMMGDVDQAKFQQWVEKASKRDDWVTLDSNHGKPFDAASVGNLVEEYKPDLVVVDGVALLNGSGESKWEKVMSIIYELKAMSQGNKVVTIGTCQASREAGENMPQPTQIAYSDAILQACDVGIMMNADPETPEVRYCTIPVVRGMAPINKRMTIRFDVNQGVIQL